MIVVDQGRPRGGIKRPKLEKGEKVVLVVRADAGESVHIHGYDIEKPVTPGQARSGPAHRDDPRPVRGRAPPSGLAPGRPRGPALSFVGHGIGSVQDLPVPTWLFYWGAGIVLVVSFVLLGALWKRPVLEEHESGRALAGGISRVVLGPLRIAVQVLSVALFALVWAAALFGDTDPYRNLAPIWILVIFWLGLPALSVVFGNVWRALSPWRALADAYVWAWERGGREARPLAEYPERLGRWPGVVAIFAFAALELAYADPSSPRSLAFAIAIYTYVALFGMAAFGRDTWVRTGEGFAVLFGLLARTRAAPRRGRCDQSALAVHRARRRRSDARDGRVRLGDARLGALRRLQPDDEVAGPDGRHRGAVPRRASRVSASCS